MSHPPVRSKDAKSIKIEINNHEVVCPEGVSVLKAAELHGFYVPSLCFHEDLSPFGGCRLCMVEIQGIRGYPLACSTLVQEGMKVLTESNTLQEMRREVLELILSEHPASCLVCGEKAGCAENQRTIRKTGVSTGCRSCPNDGQCELQTVVEKLGIEEIHYPTYYHGYEPEHDDPFYDRDYNICILCGRCVRMCQEMRGTAVLAFKHRGPKTTIGPAFGRNHVAAGCEFCGACVSVCPTGALAEKVSKWDGKPDRSTISTCPFCGLGCQVELQQKEGRLSQVHPIRDPEINDGQLCVRGRFCLPETTHHHARARKPVLKRGKYFREVTWPEAVDEVAAKLAEADPRDLLMLVSPDLTNEGLYVAQKLVRKGLASHGIDSTARWALPGGAGLWSRLFGLLISVKAISRADSILAVGLDTRFSFSVAGVEIRRALREGAKLVTIDSRESNLSRYTRQWLRPAPGEEGAVCLALVERLLGKAGGTGTEVSGVAAAEIDKAAESLESGRELAVVIGPSAFALDADSKLNQALFRLAEREHTTFLPLYQGSNTRGALELGALHGVLPGPKAAPADGLSLDAVIEGKARPKVLYLVGETPFFNRPDCEYIIAQDIYPPPFEVDAFLPAASFVETEGTLVSVEGRVQNVERVEHLPEGAITGFMRPDFAIFGEIAKKLGRDGFDFPDASAVRHEIAQTVPGFPATADRKARRLQSTMDTRSAPPQPIDGGGGGHWLIVEPGGFRHRGIDLSFAVEGLGELKLEEGFRIHPTELQKLGLRSGDPIRVSVDGIAVSGVARADQECAPGAVYLHRPFAFGGIANRREHAPLYALAGARVRVTVSPATREG